MNTETQTDTSAETIADTEVTDVRDVGNPGDAVADSVATAPAPEIRILRTANCPSLSGKSTLTYAIGTDTAGQVMLQVTANTGGGYFNADWVPQRDIQAALNTQPAGKAVTSGTLQPIYLGKSNNSPGFLLAVLLHVGLVQASKEKPRCYELRNPKAFNEGIAALLESAQAPAIAAIADAPVKGKTLTLKGKQKKTA